jgi:uncharacterized protein
MSTRLPIEVNPYRLIEQRRILNGQLTLRLMSRLQELTTNTEGNVTVELIFERTDTGLPMISSSLHTDIPLLCQRCMQSFQYEIKKTWQLVLVNTDAEAEKLQEQYEAWVVEEDRMFLQDFIEDEILLSLPVVAKHNECNLNEAAARASFSEETKQQKQKAEIKNPFASLKEIFDAKS